MSRKKHIPQRMCVACRESQDKKSLIRLVRTPEGVVVDQSGKMAGRGAYLHADPNCWEKGIKRKLAKALNTELSPQDQQNLISFQESFKTEVND
jgi:predicted RNA-binding protein YlxR (DUF448 family)